MPSVEDLLMQKPDPEGNLSLEEVGSSSYTRTKYIIESFVIQVEDCTYKSGNGVGSYEALVFQRAVGGAGKVFNLNVPSRLIPQISRGLDYFYHMRG